MSLSLDDVYKFVQATSWAAAAMAACFGVYKYFPEAKEKRLWEKAKLAKQMVDDIADNPKAMAASYMLGAWDGRRYEREHNGATIAFQVTQEQVCAVLNPRHVAQSDNEQYVRECFDDLLYHLDLCVGAAQRNIIDWDDIKPLFVTFFAGVTRSMLPPLQEYAQHSRYYRADSKLSELVEAALTTPSRAQDTAH